MSTFTVLVHADDAVQARADLAAALAPHGPLVVGEIGSLDAGIRFVRRSCMGGFCQVRDTCGWHNLQDRSEPAERLCPPGTTTCWTPRA